VVHFHAPPHKPPLRSKEEASGLRPTTAHFFGDAFVKFMDPIVALDSRQPESFPQFVKIPLLRLYT
jgi:hypothetical protein